MDLRSVVGAKESRERRWALVGVALMVVFLATGASGAPALLVAVAFGAVERMLLRRLVRTWIPKLDQLGRSLGFRPSAADDRVYEGLREHEVVRVWLEDPPALRQQGTTLLAYVVWFAASVQFGRAGFGTAVALAVLGSAWTNLRPTLEVESASESGTRRRARVHRFGAIESAIASLPTRPPSTERVALTSEVDVPGLLSRIRRSDESALLGILAALGDRGSADTVAPLLRALQQRRYPLSPRVAGLAEKALRQIRERHGLAEEGALGLSSTEDGTGRIGLASESGALSVSDENGDSRRNVRADRT
jgi:hypothetical protein